MNERTKKYFSFLVFLLMIPLKTFCHPTIEKLVFVYFQLVFISTLATIFIKYILFKIILKSKKNRLIVHIILNSICELILATTLFYMITKTGRGFWGVNLYVEFIIMFFIISFPINYLFNKFLIFNSGDFSRKRFVLLNILSSLIFLISTILTYFVFRKLEI
jgi:hypothetical protein